MLRKFLFILLSLVCVFSLLVVPSLAMGITNNIQSFGNSNRLWVPERYSVIISTPEGSLGDYNGAIYPVSPMYKVGLDKLPQTSYINITSAGSNAQIPDWARYIYHSLQYVTYSDDDYYSNTIYLSRRDNAQTYDIVYTQVDFPRSFVNKSLVNTPTDNSPGVSVELREIPSTLNTVGVRLGLACDGGEDVYYVTYENVYTVSGDAEYLNFSLSLNTLLNDAIAYAKKQGYEPYLYGNYYLVQYVSISGYSFDGTVRVRQPANADIRPLGNDDASMDSSLPNFANFMVKTLSGFFSAPLFKLGSFEVTIGTVFAVPLVLMLLIAFLKKFAGG